MLVAPKKYYGIDTQASSNVYIRTDIRTFTVGDLINQKVISLPYGHTYP